MACLRQAWSIELDRIPAFIASRKKDKDESPANQMKTKMPHANLPLYSLANLTPPPPSSRGDLTEPRGQILIG